MIVTCFGIDGFLDFVTDRVLGVILTRKIVGIVARTGVVACTFIRVEVGVIEVDVVNVSIVKISVVGAAVGTVTSCSPAVTLR